MLDIELNRFQSIRIAHILNQSVCLRFGESFPLRGAADVRVLAPPSVPVLTVRPRALDTTQFALSPREVLDSVGMLDPTVLGPSDLEYCLRLAAKFPYILEKHPSAVFTLNSESFSATQPMSSFWPGWKRMLQKFEVDDSLADAFRQEALDALRKDARRMLLRRGANGIAAGRMDFVRDAADALAKDCGQAGRARLLRIIAAMCARSALMQRMYTHTYRLAERRIVRSKGVLQAEYGNLLRTA